MSIKIKAIHGNLSNIIQQMGPGAMDQAMRNAITTIWLCMPEGARSMEDLERISLQLIKRVISNFEEDLQILAEQSEKNINPE